jgi:hypothetical protein
MAGDRQARAEQRQKTLVGGLVSKQEDQPPIGATIQERLELLAEISARAWALTGQPVPQWTRATMPGRLIRKEASK